MSRSWLFLTIPVALASIGLLSWTALSLLRTVRASVIATLPIRAEQTVAINSSGDLSLNIDSPMFARRPTNLRFELTSADGQSRIELRSLEIQTDVTSMSRARLELCAFTLPAPGNYILRIDGVDPSANYADDAIVITHRYMSSLVLHVLALVFFGTTLIGAMVVSGLVLSGKSFTAQ